MSKTRKLEGEKPKAPRPSLKRPNNPALTSARVDVRNQVQATVEKPPEKYAVIAMLQKGEVVAFNQLRKRFPEWTPNLTEADLTEADLTEADLSGAILSGADLTGADLSYAVLTRAKLVGAFLSEANFIDAILPEADLSDADLTGANFSYANLSGVIGLTPEQLSGALFKGATIDPALADAALALIRKSLKEPPAKPQS